MFRCTRFAVVVRQEYFFLLDLIDLSSIISRMRTRFPFILDSFIGEQEIFLLDFFFQTMSLMPSDEVSLLSDGRYKNFIANLEKVLKQFEYSSEWADLITNLVKVKKVSCPVSFSF